MLSIVQGSNVGVRAFAIAQITGINTSPYTPSTGAWAGHQRLTLRGIKVRAEI